MKKLDYLEKQILIIIAETHPFTFIECEKVYRRCRSFDDTIHILKLSSTLAESTDKIMHDIYNF